jgi:type VI protein secretion system component VasF
MAVGEFGSSLITPDPKERDEWRAELAKQIPRANGFESARTEPIPSKGNYQVTKEQGMENQPINWWLIAACVAIVVLVYVGLHVIGFSVL